MKFFVLSKDGLDINWSKSFLKRANLKQSGHSKQIAYNFENELYFTWMTSQGRKTYWTIVYQPIDGPPKMSTGHINSYDYSMLVDEMNKSLKEILINWLPGYLPE